MKKGFTLIELVAVITTIAIISIIAIPPIINQIKSKQKQISEVAQKIVYASTELYIDSNSSTYNEYPGNIFCVTLQSLVDNEFLIEPVIDTKTGKNIDLDYVVKVSFDNSKNVTYSMVYDGTCQEVKRGKPSKPELVDGLIPIRWDSTTNTWLKADESNPSDFLWYDYNNSKWANAVLIKDETRSDYENAQPGYEIYEEDVLGYFTWIPRYRYKLWNASGTSTEAQSIDIVFESKDTAKSTGNVNNTWLTHPAFTFDDEELNGIWVGKFETTGTLEELTVKPNLESITNQTLGSMFAATRLMEKNGNSYGLNKYQVDTHVMKNTEWGAVAYLTNSEYGRCTNGSCDEVYINNTNSLASGSVGPTITGCSGSSVSAGINNSATSCVASYTYDVNGTNASTTKNVTGIYDMNGGSKEIVMGNMVDSEGDYYSSSANLIGLESKYYNFYAYSETNYLDSNRGLVGDATKEVLAASNSETGSWNNDSSILPSGTSSWFLRGGSSNSASASGIFSYESSTGAASTDTSFRVVIVASKENREFVDSVLNGADPILYQGMIPIYFEDGKVKVANLSDEWYNYTNHNWANAVLVDTSDSTIKDKYFNDDMSLKTYISNHEVDESDILQYYVWIPRYKYKLWNVNTESSTPQAIDIVFESSDIALSTGSTNGTYLTHPAFTFGTTPLNGIWVGKFEPSGLLADIKIKPNLVSLNNNKISVAFNAIRTIETTDKYGLLESQVDTHMMKNMEWGAVAYLSSSIYGRYTNSSTCIASGCEVWINNTNTAASGSLGSTITGCSGNTTSADITNDMTTCASDYSWNQNGINASTTGNIYGIYDMSGGSWEYTMANMVDSSGNFQVSSSSFETIPNVKYYDIYTPYSDAAWNHLRGLIGDATKETLTTPGNDLGGWNSDHTRLPSTTYSFLKRGGLNNSTTPTSAGLYSFTYSNGGYNDNTSFRVVLTAE